MLCKWETCGLPEIIKAAASLHAAASLSDIVSQAVTGHFVEPCLIVQAWLCLTVTVSDSL